MTKSKKNLLILVIVLAVCAAAFAIYVIVDTVSENRRIEEEKANAVHLSTLTGSVEALTIYNGVDGSTNSYIYDAQAGSWLWAEDPELVMRSANLDNVAQGFNDLTAPRYFEINDDFAAYGFNDPSFVVSATDTNGDTCDFILGYSIDEGESFYATVRGGTMGYTIKSLYAETLAKTFWEMVPIDYVNSVSIDSSRVVELTIDGETVIYRQTPTADEGVFERTITRGSTTVSADSIGAYDLYTALLQSMAGISFDSTVDWKADSERLASYGFDNPYMTLKIDFFNAKKGTDDNITLYIGNRDETNSFYYARLENSNKVGYMKISLISEIADAAYAISPLIP